MAQETSRPDLFEERKRKHGLLMDAGIIIPYKYETTHTIAEIKDKYNALLAKEVVDGNFSVAGYITSMRTHGKLCFLDIADRTGQLQIMCQVDNLGDKYNHLKNFDILDWIGLRGHVIKTSRGELSILAKDYDLLGKCFLPAPNLRNDINIERKYRQRYLHLRLDPKARDTFVKRSKAIAAMREYLSNRGFTEVEIPLVQPVYGGAAARPFITKVNALDQDWFLSISPEMYLKRLIVGGMERVYTITKNFRNESIDTTHNPEFTMMECYQTYADLYDMMTLTEEVIAHMAKKITGSTKVKFGDKEIDLTPPFKRLTMEDAVRRYSKIDISNIPDEALQNIVDAEELDLGPRPTTRPNVIHALFEKYAEEHLVEPTFIHDYPVDISPLTRKHREKRGWVERFELYINKVEIANAYTELIDPFDQKQRLEQQVEDGKKGDEEAHPMDEDFVNALMYGMPPTGGLGIGLDRVIMFLTNSQSIKDVILFPMMRREENKD